MDKLNEFRRINEPRVQRALDQLNHIEKSAVSMRIDRDDIVALMQPVLKKLAPPTTPDQTVRPIEATPPVAKEMADLSNLSTQQLVDRMIACGAELAKRRQ